jgi:hypothetical protein
MVWHNDIFIENYVLMMRRDFLPAGFSIFAEDRKIHLRVYNPAEITAFIFDTNCDEVPSSGGIVPVA